MQVGGLDTLRPVDNLNAIPKPQTVVPIGGKEPTMSQPTHFSASLPRHVGIRLGAAVLVCFALLFFALSVPAAHAQSQPGTPNGTPSDQHVAPQGGGSITGTVVDRSGAVVVGAKITLSQPNQSTTQETLSGNSGEFSFANVPAGPFKVSVAAQGFASADSGGVLQPNDTFIVQPITLPLAANLTSVEVLAPGSKLAEQQIKQEEQQRVLAVFPNFYVSYLPNAAPLGSKQKFELAWKTTIDPVTLIVVVGIAGIQQANNQYGAYGQGVQGYGKRFGAAYVDTAAGTFFGSAILPAIFKQDPRYFYKGTGSGRARLLYAVANAFICKGDNKRWQPNYSNILGNVAAGGVSNLYYPANDRGAALTFESAAIGIGATAAANVLEEFVMKKLTTTAHAAPKAANPIKFSLRVKSEQPLPAAWD